MAVRPRPQLPPRRHRRPPEHLRKPPHRGSSRQRPTRGVGETGQTSCRHTTIHDAGGALRRRTALEALRDNLRYLEHGLAWIGAGVIALGLYGFVTTLPPGCQLRPHSGRLRRCVRRRIPGLRHGRRRVPSDRWDVIGALVCLVGVAVIMHTPRG
ncbi:hypothetical protein [Nonomuraea sp. NPDC046570]|uniref:hypothetical protein n=1 Tax=Nonomuraea sp. NPDC046570 TaxID=3155255 RepID=UPI00340F3DFB